jgi:hypothetical protein
VPEAEEELVLSDLHDRRHIVLSEVKVFHRRQLLAIDVDGHDAYAADCSNDVKVLLQIMLCDFVNFSCLLLLSLCVSVEFIELRGCDYREFRPAVAVKQVDAEVLSTGDNVVWVRCLTEAVDIAYFLFIFKFNFRTHETVRVSGCHVGDNAFRAAEVSSIPTLSLAKDLKLDFERILQPHLLTEKVQMHFLVFACHIDECTRSEGATILE